MINTIRFILTHPFNKNSKLTSILRYIKWQVCSRIWSGSLVFNWIDDSKLVLSKGMTGATGNVYVGLMEYEDMSFLLHFLQEDDLFFDIGANVGVYTVLASKVKQANTVCIEPLPSTYEKLKDNIQINRLNNIISLNIGLSYEKTKLYFTTDRDTMNSVALPSDTNVQEVDIDTLDNLSRIYGTPKVIKIDVEGYETNVLYGAAETLANQALEVIILELNKSGEKFGFNDDDIHSDLVKLGFQACTYNPFERNMIKLNKYGSHNTIYIRKNSFEQVEMILKNAAKFNCNGLSI